MCVVRDQEDGRMRVNLLLPSSGQKISGGFKVVYEYANLIARVGHRVFLIHPALTYKGTHGLRRAIAMSRYLQRRLDQSYSPRKWFGPFAGGVEILWVPSLSERWIPNADVVMASGWQTAEWMTTYGPLKGRQLYLVHDYEHYMNADSVLRARIERTYLTQARKIVTSPAGEELMNAAGISEYSYVPNGIDFSVFRLQIAISSPLRRGIGFAWRRETFKGAADAISAIAEVQEKAPGCYKYWTFGEEPPTVLPSWLSWYRRPSDIHLADLMNRTAIFVSASHYEGWGLPGAEAMACGAALVSTDNGGVRAYAVHGKTALLSPVRSPKALAQHVLQLLADESMRARLADQGATSIRQFTWENAWKVMSKLLEDH